MNDFLLFLGKIAAFFTCAALFLFIMGLFIQAFVG